MYGSIFCSVTRKPRASRSDPIEAAARPLPNDDTTPPVTKMYFVATSASSRHPVSDLCDLHRAVRDASVKTPVPQLGEHPRDCRPARDPECHDLVAGERDERAVEPEVPVEDGACAAVAHEPEPREHHGCLLAEYARAGARSVRIAQPHDERAPLGEGVTETRERLARERQSLERRRRDRLRLVTGDGQRAELDRLDAEAARPPPPERPRQLGEQGRGRGGEAVTRVQETEGAVRSEPRERQPGARLAEDPLQLGGDRKSTRLDFSLGDITYSVFLLE